MAATCSASIFGGFEEGIPTGGRTPGASCRLEALATGTADGIREELQRAVPASDDTARMMTAGRTIRESRSIRRALSVRCQLSSGTAPAGSHFSMSRFQTSVSGVTRPVRASCRTCQSAIGPFFPCGPETYQFMCVLKVSRLQTVRGKRRFPWQPVFRNPAGDAPLPVRKLCLADFGSIGPLQMRPNIRDAAWMELDQAAPASEAENSPDRIDRLLEELARIILESYREEVARQYKPAERPDQNTP